ncbi:MAG: hypothetical protein A2286_00035 [Gammaproteobacteria bacterium RIFOXYA12_FULL_61_12]|nr:MAG: hypothetical protein A2514_11440 [Gammaproteobacteria bacterium RIFOXYD12_FULL_61_37]OGT90756.1 MAG: hypothetical protein A2286_00035 [Gammaproteobacteria bacterium RIFOXYA12_FULL_61_12]
MKQISNGDLAEIVTSLLVGRGATNQLDSTESFSAFMTGIAQVICDHCGGEVVGKADSSFEEWLVTVASNDSLPEDGGIWADYDPDGSLIDGNEEKEEAKA